MPYPPRPMYFLRPGAPLVCRAGHVIPWTTQLLEDGFPRCTHRAGGQGECGARMYVLLLPRRIRGRPLILVADVTSAEIRALLDLSGDVDDVLTMLGIMWGREEATRGEPPPTIARLPKLA